MLKWTADCSKKYCDKLYECQSSYITQKYNCTGEDRCECSFEKCAYAVEEAFYTCYYYGINEFYRCEEYHYEAFYNSTLKLEPIHYECVYGEGSLEHWENTRYYKYFEKELEMCEENYSDYSDVYYCYEQLSKDMYAEYYYVYNTMYYLRLRLLETT